MRDGDDPPAEPALAIVVKGWPRLSETFIAREVLALEQRGVRLQLWSLRHPTDRKRHAMVARLAATVGYLPEYLWREPLRLWRGWRQARAMPGYGAAKAQWLADWRRDPTPNRGRRFGQALVLAAELPPATRHIHAQFLHTPSSVARYAAMMRGLSWSASAHAKDVWTTPAWEQREKLGDAAFVVTCTQLGCAHLAGLAPPGRVALLYHGLAPEDFPDPGERIQQRDGHAAADPVRLLSVGRAVPKKGFDVLIDALALLPRDLAWRLVHIGGGALRGELERRAARAGIAARIDWRGAGAADEVLAAYRAADLFVLPSRIAADGDRDGLPNVLMEAMSQRLPCIASAVAAIPELIAADPASGDATGVLVPPDDPAALAAALARLIADPAARVRLGAAGFHRVRATFSFADGIDRLLGQLDAVGIEAGGIRAGGIRPVDITASAAVPCASSSTRR